MKVTINQTINNLLTENREIITTRKTEVYILKPDAGKVLRNKKTAELIYNAISLKPTDKISDFEEIDIPDTH